MSSGSTGSDISLLLKWLISLRIIPRAAVTQLESNYAPYASSVLDAGRLAEKTYAVLDKLDQDVVLIARIGQNLSQFGLRYSHLGFAVRGVKRDEWGIVHLLNRDSSNKSGIYQEGLVNFYSDNPYLFESIIVTLPFKDLKNVKEKLLLKAKDFHCENYSLTSYPWNLATQNSNQWVLEFLAHLFSECENREQAQAWLKEHNFRPTSLPIKKVTQWFGPLLKDSISFNDQPLEIRNQDQVQTITVDSVLNFLEGEDSPFKNDKYRVSKTVLSI